MSKYSKPVWQMCKEAAAQLGGKYKWIPLLEIVKQVQKNYPEESVNKGTIRDQIFRHCVNCHPTHDHFPDRGKSWRERKVFVTDGKGNYRLFDEVKDKEIYEEELRRDGIVGNKRNIEEEETAMGSGRPSMGTSRKILVGRVLGNYQIEEEIGQGAMGVVYLGYHLSDVNKKVAIKIYLPEKPLKRFNEIKNIMLNLKHENIISVEDVGIEGSIYYIIMEYVEGRNLKEIIDKEKRILLKRAINIITDVCSALNYAHKKGVIHKDLKPSNILIEKNGKAKLGDFDIAEMVSEHILSMDETEIYGKDDTTKIYKGLSGEETFLEGNLEKLIEGTIAYMSPEQKEGKKLTFSSDIYSLGVIFYEMLTGKRQITLSIPSELNPDLPKEIDDIVKGMLHSVPTKRYSIEKIMEKLNSINIIKEKEVTKSEPFIKRVVIPERNFNFKKVNLYNIVHTKYPNRFRKFKKNRIVNLTISDIYKVDGFCVKFSTLYKREKFKGIKTRIWDGVEDFYESSDVMKDYEIPEKFEYKEIEIPVNERLKNCNACNGKGEFEYEEESNNTPSQEDKKEEIRKVKCNVCKGKGKIVEYECYKIIFDPKEISSVVYKGIDRDFLEDINKIVKDFPGIILFYKKEKGILEELPSIGIEEIDGWIKRTFKYDVENQEKLGNIVLQEIILTYIPITYAATTSSSRNISAIVIIGEKNFYVYLKK